MSELTDEVVPISNVYFESANEHIIFLYPDLDLSPMDFLKVICGGKMVEEDVVASPELGSLASLYIAHGGVKKGGEFGDPQPKNVVEEEMPQGEDWWWFGFTCPNWLYISCAIFGNLFYFDAPSGAFVIVLNNRSP